MGYMRHDALIITGGTAYPPNRDGWKLLRDTADSFTDPELFGRQGWSSLLVGPIPGVVNGDQTMVFVPDGSKEGWPESAAGDRLRLQLIEIADSHELDWAHVSFGGDDPHTAELVAFNNDERPEENA